MTTLPMQGAHTTGVVRLLEEGGLLVGLGRKPDGVPTLPDGQTPARGYVVLWPLPGERPDGPVSSPAADAALGFQATCVAADMVGAQDEADAVVELMLSGTLAVDGRAVTFVELEATAGVTRDDDVSPALFYATPRFRVHTTPA